MAERNIINKIEKRMIVKLNKSFENIAIMVATLVENGDIKTDLAIEMWFAELVPWLLSDIKQLYVRWWRLIKKKMQLKTWNEYIVEQAIKYVLDKKNEMLWQSKLSITQTTKEKITWIIANWLNKWEWYDKIWKKIREQVQEWIFSPARSQLIAVREVWHAYENWRKKTIQDHLAQTWQQAQKIRDTVQDDKVTELCRANEAKWWILFNELRPTGDEQAPRNWNPRCRCTVNYRII